MKYVIDEMAQSNRCEVLPYFCISNPINNSDLFESDSDLA